MFLCRVLWRKKICAFILINTTIQFCNTGKAECIWHKNNSLELKTRKTTLLKKDFFFYFSGRNIKTGLCGKS